MTNQLVSIVSSLIISEHFRKAHRTVLRKIQLLDCSEEFGRHNFVQSSYKNGQNKEQPCYKITKDGFMFLVMGFTGKEAAMWKERFIKTFNEMEEKLREQDAPSKAEYLMEYLKGQQFVLHVDYGGTIHCEIRERKSPYEGLAKAIRTRSNYGLNDDVIREIGLACTEALADRAVMRREELREGKAKIKELIDRLKSHEDGKPALELK